ncbi:MAG: hypothetical protein JNJ49_13705 [Bdellovibrionaceae bacterium]|nr:hypothetical protein [Pseudobdellovibrionaceae bacterium]
MMHRAITLTLVCILTATAPKLAHAAKTSPSPEDSLDTPKPATVPSTEELERAGQVEMSVAPAEVGNKPQNPQAYYFRYRQSITVRGGIEQRFNDIGSPGSILSILYWFPRKDLRGIEGGADLQSDGSGTIHIASRNVVGKGRWRGFHKLGGGVRIVPSDQMVTFLRLKNWQLRMSGGVEYSISDPYTLRLDLDGTVSTERMAALLTFGVAWNW